MLAPGPAGQGIEGPHRALDTPRLNLSAKLVDYVERTRPRVAYLRHLFLSPPTRVRSTMYEPLTSNAMKCLMRRLSLTTGIHIHAHAFRHSWATQALREGVDMEALRKARGWTNYRMVQRYTHYLPDDLVAAWDRRRR